MDGRSVMMMMMMTLIEGDLEPRGLKKMKM